MGEEKQRELEQLTISALLHDIGKFYQRAGYRLEAEDDFWVTRYCKREDNRYIYLHAAYSGKFIRNQLPGHDWLEDIAGYHHNVEESPVYVRRLAKILTLSDWLSAGERKEREGEGEAGHYSKEPLLSIFSTLVIKHEKGLNRYIPLGSLSSNLNGLTPVDSKQDAISQDVSKFNSYSYLWNQFLIEFNRLDKENLLRQLLYLLEKFTITIPSATYEDIPDISLFHHLKSTAAIAACLHHLALPEEKIDALMNQIRKGEIYQEGTQGVMDETGFYLVGGDISGIQDFIYSLTTEKALKGLRGRSLYVQLLSEIAAEIILEKFSLPPTNLLYCGGGHFFLLIPAMENVENELRDLKKNLDDILLKAHQARLAIILGWRPLKYGDLFKFSDIWAELGAIMAKKKRQKLADLAAAEGKYEQIFGPFETGGRHPACNICNDEMEKETEEGMCSLCLSFAELSSDLAKANYMLIKPVDSRPLAGKPQKWWEIFNALGYSYRFLRDEKEPWSKKSLILNSTEFAGKYAGFKFVAKSTPRLNGEIMTLEDIANQAEGIKKWGILRSDIDGLGEVFKNGLAENRTISRLSTLSSFLSLYFSAKIDHLIQANPAFQNKIYVIYSGGDDLCLLGAWSVLPIMAQQIYDDFKKFSAGRLTLSSGIYLAPGKKFPVYEAAKKAGEAEDEAKKIEQKNRINFLDCSLNWDEFRTVEEVKAKLTRLIKENEEIKGRPLPRSLLSTLLSISREIEKDQEGTARPKKDVAIHKVWRLFYAFRRLLREYKEDDPQFIELNQLRDKIIIDYRLWPHLNVAVRWAEYLTREEKS